MIELEIKYELGHSYRETWDQEPWHCPKCGQSPVWMNQGPGDYYEGPQFLCGECGWTWTMPRISGSAGWQDEQRLAAIGGTPAGTSTSTDPSDQQNAGSKPEAREYPPFVYPADYPR